MEKILCRECVFNKIVNDTDGECRLNTPKMDDKGYAVWPMIRGYKDTKNFCYHGKKNILHG